MLSDQDFRRLLIQLDRPWAGYRKVRKGVKKRVRRHMEQVGCRNIEDYLKLLQSQPDAKRACEECLYVTISRFFRDRKFWQDLEERLFPGLVQDFDLPLRIWSAGCASGEEAYSIALVFRLVASPTGLELLATDAQQICLKRAREGRFGQSSLKELSSALRSEFFTSHKSGRQFSVKSKILPPIQWRQHDLLHESPPPGPFHMIFLRNNLLTYHQGPDLLSAFSRIESVLTAGGYLVVGSHERLPENAGQFARDTHCPWVYRKTVS